MGEVGKKQSSKIHWQMEEENESESSKNKTSAENGGGE